MVDGGGGRGERCCCWYCWFSPHRIALGLSQSITGQPQKFLRRMSGSYTEWCDDEGGSQHLRSTNAQKVAINMVSKNIHQYSDKDLSNRQTGTFNVTRRTRHKLLVILYCHPLGRFIYQVELIKRSASEKLVSYQGSQICKNLQRFGDLIDNNLLIHISGWHFKEDD